MPSPLSLLVPLVLVCTLSTALEGDQDLDTVFPVLVEARFKNFRRKCPDRAECVLIDDCPKLRRLLKQPSTKNIRRLQSSTCRIVDRRPYVCCHKNDVLRESDPTAPAPTATAPPTAEGPSVVTTAAEAPSADPSQASAAPDQSPPAPEGSPGADEPDAPAAPVPEQAPAATDASAETPPAEPSTPDPSPDAAGTPDAPTDTAGAAPDTAPDVDGALDAPTDTAGAAPDTAPDGAGAPGVDGAPGAPSDTAGAPDAASAAAGTASAAIPDAAGAPDAAHATGAPGAAPDTAGTAPGSTPDAAGVPDAADAEAPSVATRFLSSGSSEHDYDYLDEEEKPECGFSGIAMRIFGGKEVLPHSWPWVAVLGYGFTPEDVYWACGATLIGPGHVLTAAHCVTEQTPDGVSVVTDLLRVRLGEHDLFNDNDGPVVDAVPEHIIVHDNYTGRPKYTNDIAIIQLDRNVSYTENISPVCLPGMLRPPVPIPGTEPTARADTGGAPYIVSGWGSDGVRHGTDRLMEVEVTQVNGTACREHFGKFNIPVEDSTQLCAGGHGVDSCSGDSGGPLVQEVDHQYELVGVVSLGGVICGGKIPGLYTRVQAYTDWISDVVTNGH